MENNIQFTVKTKINDSWIQQTVFNNFKEIISKRLVDTEEEQFKNVLISLGWTPPKETL